MKKIFFSLFAVAAIAACTKSEMTYEESDAIGFQVVTGKMTKASVTNNVYPDALNMYVFAMTETAPGVPNISADYLNNAEFAKVLETNGQKLWGGWLDDAAYPYYWPNVKKLYFAGVSKSGNVNNGAVPAYSNGTITINGYEPGVGTDVPGDNDLMWFPTTPRSYGKGDVDAVTAVMKHACSWITIKMAGDPKYKITDIHIEGLTTKGNVALNADADWTLSTVDADKNQTFSVYANATGTELSSTPTAIETVPNNTVVLPEQVPGTLSISYYFTSPAGVRIDETVTGSLEFSGETAWAAGTHYTYTVTIDNQKILIAPEVTDWTPSPEEGSHGVTVQ